MIDGVPHGETTALLEPYFNHTHNGFTGELHFTEATIRDLVSQLDAAGFALHLHIMGDRGIRVALDAIEAARATKGAGRRHHIAHLSMVQPRMRSGSVRSESPPTSRASGRRPTASSRRSSATNG
jgi:predicted amidohydrolase YtcJ